MRDSSSSRRRSAPDGSWTGARREDGAGEVGVDEVVGGAAEAPASGADYARRDSAAEEAVAVPPPRQPDQSSLQRFVGLTP